MEQPSDLLACPYCGGTNIQITSPSNVQPRHFVALCTNDVDKPGCGASSQWHRVPAEARGAWNRRAGAGRASQDNGGKQLCSSAWLDALTKSVESAVEHWQQHGATLNFEDKMNWAEIRLDAFRRHAESASNGVFSCREPEQLSTTQGDQDGKHTNR